MDEKTHGLRIERLTAALSLARESAFPDASRARIARGQCLLCKQPLGNEKQMRRMHEKCYRSVKRDLEKGLYSEGDAIANGIWALEQKSGRKAEERGVRAMMVAETPARYQHQVDDVVAAILDLAAQPGVEPSPPAIDPSLDPAALDAEMAAMLARHTSRDAAPKRASRKKRDAQ